MFDEDLTEFFDPAEFGTSVSIRRPDNTELRTAVVIIEEPSEDEQFYGQGRVTASVPKATGRTADLAGVARDFKLVTDAAAYVVVEPPKGDGTGVSTVKLRKA